MEALSDQSRLVLSLFMPVVNLYYKSHPHREWQLLGLRRVEALHWRSWGETHLHTRPDTHSHNLQRVRVKAKASVYYDIFKIG